MASLYKKVVSGRPYWYLRQMARVDGKPKGPAERCLVPAADIEALLEAREVAALPARTRHLGFGDVAATWGVLERLDVIGVIDSVVGTRRADVGAPVGAYLALAALNRVVAPTSKLQFEHWWKTTAADRFTAIPASVLDHRRFWDAMHAITLEQVAQIEHLLALAMTEAYGLDISALALDMTNFATYIDTGNEKAPIAQRGKAKQKRADLRLVGLGLVVTRDGGVPLVSHAYPGNRPDVTQFATMIDLLCARHGPCRRHRRPHPGAGDGGLRRRAELGRELHPPERCRPGVRWFHPTLTGRRPARPTRARPHPRRRRPLRGPDRAGDPPGRLRPRPASDPDSLTDSARRPAGRIRPDPGQGRRQAHRTGRHAGPRQDPPPSRQGQRPDRRDPTRPVATPRPDLPAHRRNPRATPTERPDRPGRPRRAGSRGIRQ